MESDLSNRRSGNQHYQTQQISDFFSKHRRNWDELYSSEQWILQSLINKQKGKLGNILDIGCAGGGLFDALSSKSLIESYHGVDINPQVIDIAKKTHLTHECATFECADILDSDTGKAIKYELVCSLSCADWNIETKEIINRAWDAVKAGGSLLISLRLTNRTTANDVLKSYQYILYEDRAPRNDDEIASYVVFNYKDAICQLLSLESSPLQITGYGYWGKPSRSARTPFEDIVFSVFLVEKASNDNTIKDTVLNLHLPSSLMFPAHFA